MLLATERQKGASDGHRHAIWDSLQIGRPTTEGEEMRLDGFMEELALLGSD